MPVKLVRCRRARPVVKSASMNPGLWGLCTAFEWGGGDFIARFTGRGVGHANALLGMLLVGSLVLSTWVLVSGSTLVWQPAGLWLLAVAGLGVMVGTLLLYRALAEGPVSIVSPIIASYPAGVVAIAVALGARPSVYQWLAMAGVMAGVIVVARSTGHFELTHGYPAEGLRRTVAISLLSMVAFAVGVSAGQAAVPVYGELQTIWLSRLVSLVSLLILLAARRQRIHLPGRWWPLLAIQGLLDGGGYLTLFAGSAGEDAEIAAVAASGFGAVTVLLARVVLRETMTWAQWGGIALVFGCIAVLSAGL